MKKRLVCLFMTVLVCCGAAFIAACKDGKEPPAPVPEGSAAASIAGAKDYDITTEVTDFGFLTKATGMLEDGSVAEVTTDTSAVRLGESGAYDIVYTLTAGGKKVTETRKVRVYGAPSVTATDATVYYHVAPDYDVRDMISAKDSLGGDMEVTVTSDGGFAQNRLKYGVYTVSFSAADRAGQTRTASATLTVAAEADKQPTFAADAYAFDAQSQTLDLSVDLKGERFSFLEIEGEIADEGAATYDAGEKTLSVRSAAFGDISQSEISLTVRSTHGYAGVTVDLSEAPVSVVFADGVRFTRSAENFTLSDYEVASFGSYVEQKRLLPVGGGAPIDLSEETAVPAGTYDLKISAENRFGGRAEETVRMDVVSAAEYAALVDDMGSAENSHLYRATNFVGSELDYFPGEKDGVRGSYRITPVTDVAAGQPNSQLILEPFVTDREAYGWLTFDVLVDAADVSTIEFFCEFHALSMQKGSMLPFPAGKWTTIGIDLRSLYATGGQNVATDTHGFSLLTKGQTQPYYMKNIRLAAGPAGLRTSFESSYEMCNKLYVPYPGVNADMELNADPAYVSEGRNSVKLTSKGEGFNFVVTHASWLDPAEYTHYVADVYLLLPSGGEGTANLYHDAKLWKTADGSPIAANRWNTVSVLKSSEYVQFADAVSNLPEGWVIYIDNVRMEKRAYASDIAGARDYHIAAGQSDLSFLQAVTGVMNDGSEPQGNVETDTSALDGKLNVPGEYVIRHTFTAGGETVVKEQKVYVYGEPVLTAEDRSIFNHQTGYDVKKMVIAAADGFGSDLEISVTDTGGFDAQNPADGVYTISFSVTDRAGQVKTATAALTVTTDPDRLPSLSAYAFGADALEITADLKGAELLSLGIDGGASIDLSHATYDAAEGKLSVSRAGLEGLTNETLTLVVATANGSGSIAVNFAAAPVRAEIPDGVRFTRSAEAFALPAIDAASFGGGTEITMGDYNFSEGADTTVAAGNYTLTVRVTDMFGNTAVSTAEVNVVSAAEYAALVDDMGSSERESAVYRKGSFIGGFRFVPEERDGVRGSYEVTPKTDVAAGKENSIVDLNPFVTDLETYGWLTFDVLVDAADVSSIRFLCAFYAQNMHDGSVLPFPAGKWTTISIDLRALQARGDNITTDTSGFTLLAIGQTKPYYMKNIRRAAGPAGLRTSFEGSYEICNSMNTIGGLAGAGVDMAINTDPAYVSDGHNSLKLTFRGTGVNFVVDHPAWLDSSAYTHYVADVYLVPPEDGDGTEKVYLYHAGSSWARDNGETMITAGEWQTVSVSVSQPYIQFSDVHIKIAEGWVIYIDNLRMENRG